MGIIHDDNRRTPRWWLVLVFVAMVFVFFMTALALGKDALISDLLMLIIALLGGGAVGYVLGYTAGKNEPPNRSQ